MINLPKLDDQNYTEIVEAAKRRIPVIFPEWTDFNEHDPGITVIELFAWLKEMQQYKLDRIPDSVREAMLLLAGAEPLRPAPAAVWLAFMGMIPERLPAGSTAVSADGAVFTLEQPFASEGFAISRVCIRSADGFVDVTDISSGTDTSFYPFGTELDCAGRYLYICIDKPVRSLSLNIITEDRHGVPRNPYEGTDGAPRRLVWEYSSPDGFRRCGSVKDETHGLSFPGRVILRTGGDIAACTAEVPYDGIWLRAWVEYSGCEDMPLLSGIFANTVELTQKRREAAFADLTMTGCSAEVEDVLAAQGERVVMLRDKYGWFDIPEPPMEISGSRVRFDLSEYSGRTAGDGRPDVRVIFCTSAFAGVNSFSSSGLSDQEFPFDPDETPLTDELKIMVLDRRDSREPRWNDYSYIEDLALAGAYDRVFTYDEERRVLIFGDNENGEVPPVGSDNILIVSCSLTRGATGNLSAGNLTGISSGAGSFAAVQPADASGGRDRESYEAALRRFRYELSDCQRAVSAEDYRRLAMRTPGLRIADVKAIPFFDPDDRYAPAEKLRNIMTLAVLPYSRSSRPVPDRAFLDAVRSHMEKSRLLTVELKTCAPVYVTINISAEILCGSSEVEPVRRNAEKLLRGMFSVYSHRGSRFGEPVLEAELISRLCSADGVLSVKRLQITSDSPECVRTAAGIQIPPNAIACCGAVELIPVEKV